MHFKKPLVFCVLLLWHQCLIHGLQPNSKSRNDPASSSSSATAKATMTTATTSILNQNDLLYAIRNGRVYQQDHFLNEEQVVFLLNEIQQFENENKFITKGLSNTANQSQQFSTKQDRSICIVPWFIDALQQQQQQQQSYTENRNDDRIGIPSKLQKLQLEVATLLDRPTMADATLNHECYYSLSKVGSFLPRHMDERHEEIKGAQGWLLPSRRSLSWLIYLSEPADWNINENGGALRTFPQKTILERTSKHGSITRSSHEENLQIGWIQYKNDECSSNPVYMDSCFLPLSQPKDESSADSSKANYIDLHCILYCVDPINEQKVYLTRPWLTEALQGMPVPEFIKACSEHDVLKNKSSSMLLFTTQEYAKQFSLIEDRQSWNDGQLPKGSIVEDIAPVRGRLVVFDSVQLPHEVQVITSGTRCALAGWFHEKTQEIKYY